MSWTDFNAGRILDTIEEQGFANDTAVIFNGAFCRVALVLVLSGHGWMEALTRPRVPQVTTAGTWASRAAGASERTAQCLPSERP